MFGIISGIVQMVVGHRTMAQDELNSGCIQVKSTVIPHVQDQSITQTKAPRGQGGEEQDQDDGEAEQRYSADVAGMLCRGLPGEIRPLH